MALGAILAPLSAEVVAAGLISAGVTYWATQKKGELGAIVEERRQWREDLRRAGVAIGKARSLFQLREALGELKVRLNPNGLLPEADYFQDSHLWKCIEEADRLPPGTSGEALEQWKERFVRLIAVQLKYDWERSKDEVRGNKRRNTAIGIYLLAIAFLALEILFSPGAVPSQAIRPFMLGALPMELVIYGVLFYLAPQTAPFQVFFSQPMKKGRWRAGRHGDLLLLVGTVCWLVFLLAALCLEGQGGVILYTRMILGFLMTIPFACFYDHVTRMVRRDCRFVRAVEQLMGGNAVKSA